MAPGLDTSDNRKFLKVSPFVELALCTFGILVLELAIIRWMSSQIRIVAYFSNVVLLASFLGMGLGIALGSRCGAQESSIGMRSIGLALDKARASIPSNSFGNRVAWRIIAPA